RFGSVIRRKGEVAGLMNERGWRLSPPKFEVRSLPPRAWRPAPPWTRPSGERAVLCSFLLRPCLRSRCLPRSLRGERHTYTSERARPRAAKRRSKRVYEPRIVGEHIMTQWDFERLHALLLETDGLLEIPGGLREVIEEE